MNSIGFYGITNSQMNNNSQVSFKANLADKFQKELLHELRTEHVGEEYLGKLIKKYKKIPINVTVEEINTSGTPFIRLSRKGEEKVYEMATETGNKLDILEGLTHKNSLGTPKLIEITSKIFGI